MAYEKKKLKDCCSSISDGDHLPPPKAERGVPFITISNIDGNNQIDFSDVMFVPEEYYNNLPVNKKPECGDILYSVVGSFGKPVYVHDDKKFVFQRHIAILKPGTNVDGRYLYYTMLNPMFYRLADKIAIGCAQRTITLDALRNVEVNVPTLDEQKDIANILRIIDEKISLNNRVNENLEQMTKTIYDYWFTQFDFPDETGKPYRSSGGKMVWNDELKREIPVGWTVASIIKNPLSTVIKPGVNYFGHKEYLATADIDGTSISKGNIVEYDTRESRANMQPCINSVWFAKMKNSVKHLFLNKEMQSLIDTTILSTGFCGIQCTGNSFEYISSFVSSDYFEIKKDILAHGATQEAVNNDDMLSILLLIPDDKTLSRYHEICKGLYSQISKNICENRELTAIRDWLLPLLMNGQATISD